MTESLADQNNPDLDFLFAEWSTIGNREAGNLISNKIWKRWVLVDDPEVRNLLSTGIRAMRQNKLIVALSLFDTIVRKESKPSEGWNKPATVYYLLGDHANSIWIYSAHCNWNRDISGQWQKPYWKRLHR